MPTKEQKQKWFNERIEYVIKSYMMMGLPTNQTLFIGKSWEYREFLKGNTITKNGYTITIIDSENKEIPND